jgi:hypothetical protein
MTREQQQAIASKGGTGPHMEPCRSGCRRSQARTRPRQAVKQAWRAGEAVHGARPAVLPLSTATEAALTDTVVELLKPNLGGAGTHMGIVERREIAVAFLTHRQLRTVSALAKHFNRSREAVAPVCAARRSRSCATRSTRRR